MSQAVNISRRFIAFFCLLLASLTASHAQVDDNIISATDSSAVSEPTAPIVPADTTLSVDGHVYRFIRSLHVDQVQGRSPETAAMYAAVLPGLGQVYNHKYWKLPLLYGGAAALVYAIHFNNKYYKKYSSAYRDILLMDPNNKSYMEFANKWHLTEEEVTVTYLSWFKTTLSNRKNYYRRYRDLSIFGMAGLYVVQIVDACVDAHFFNFDVSDDLAVRWSPSLQPADGSTLAGANIAISF